MIAIYFQARNSNFLTAGNFVNLIAQMAAIMIIGTGIVFVLLLGEIDLSVGYVSGMGGVIAALLLEPGKGVPTSVALALALGTGIAIGRVTGLLRGQGRRSLVRGHARGPAGLERGALTDHRQLRARS